MANVGEGAGAMAGDMSTRTVWVANYDSDTVSAVSERTGKVTAVIPVGADPDAVAVDSRTGLVFVVNGGSGYGEAGDAGTVTVVSEAAGKAVATITVGPSPDGVAVDKQTGTVYVSDGNFGAPGTIEGPPPGFVSAISEKTRKVTATWDAGVGPESLAVDPAGGSLFVSDLGGMTGGSVDELSLKTGAVTGGFGAAFRSGGIVADPADRAVWVMSVSDNAGYDPTVTGFSEVTGKAVESVRVAGTALESAMAVDPQAGDVYVGGDSLGVDGLTVVGVAAGAVAAQIPLNAAPGGIAADPCTGDVWVDGGGGEVSVISPA